MSEHSRHKRSKMGCLPGDIAKHFKIAMLEKDVPIKVFDWQILTVKTAKSYRKDFQRKANRRWRHNSPQEIQKEIDVKSRQIQSDSTRLT